MMGGAICYNQYDVTILLTQLASQLDNQSLLYKACIDAPGVLLQHLIPKGEGLCYKFLALHFSFMFTSYIEGLLNRVGQYFNIIAIPRYLQCAISVPPMFFLLCNITTCAILSQKIIMYCGIVLQEYKQSQCLTYKLF